MNKINTESCLVFSAKEKKRGKDKNQFLCAEEIANSNDVNEGKDEG